MVHRWYLNYVVLFSEDFKSSYFLETVFKTVSWPLDYSKINKIAKWVFLQRRSHYAGKITV